MYRRVHTLLTLCKSALRLLIRDSNESFRKKTRFFYKTTKDIEENMVDHSHMNHEGHSMQDASTAATPMDHKGHNHDHMAMTGSTSGDGGMNMNHGSMMMSMSMSFHFGYKETILFDFWKINSIGGLIGSMLGIFLLSVLYEGLKVFREYHLSRSLIKDNCPSRNGSNSPKFRRGEEGQGEAIITNNHNGENGEVLVQTQFRPHPISFTHVIQTLLHLIQVVISYLLMLIFMTYNVWLALAVALGLTAGFFIFGWRKRTVIDANEHCH